MIQEAAAAVRFAYPRCRVYVEPEAPEVDPVAALAAFASADAKEVTRL